jgi:hypothetical protein
MYKRPCKERIFPTGEAGFTLRNKRGCETLFPVYKNEREKKVNGKKIVYDFCFIVQPGCLCKTQHTADSAAPDHLYSFYGGNANRAGGP